MHKEKRVVLLIVWRASVRDWLAQAQSSQSHAQGWEYTVELNILT